jgi:hypothetical protein
MSSAITPDFYLGSQELTGWAQARAVTIVGDG